MTGTFKTWQVLVPKLPRPTGREMVRFLQSLGFRQLRVRGSHHILAREDLRTSVPVHAGRVLKIGTLKAILRDIDLEPASFEQLWRNR